MVKATLTSGPSLPSNPTPEDYGFTMPVPAGGIEVRFFWGARVVFMIEALGDPDVVALKELQDWCDKQGWFLYVKAVQPETIQEKGKAK
jgi:hypothetical protein